MTTLLDVRNLKTHFFTDQAIVPAVDGVDIQIKKGETVAIVGESGSGKSITSLSIMKLVPRPGEIVSGKVYLDGVDLLALSEKEMCHVRGNEMAMIFQEPMTSLNPVLTIKEQMTEALIYHQKLSKKEAIEKTMDLLEMVGFSRAEELINDYPHRLSGGMRQRVMIAIAMSCNPKLLIADEPTTALDVTIQAQILDLMRKINKQFQTSILLITHNLGVVSEVAQKVLVMYCGQVVEQAAVDDLFDEPLHPYTIGLINSIPSINQELDRLIPIEGNVPAPENYPNGCRFAPRCPRAFDRCVHEKPNLLAISTTRSVRCFLYDQKEGKE